MKTLACLITQLPLSFLNCPACRERRLMNRRDPKGDGLGGLGHFGRMIGIPVYANSILAFWVNPSCNKSRNYVITLLF